MAYLPRSSLVQFDENRSYKLDLNKLEKPYLNANMIQILSKSVQQFERRSRKSV